jgi:hypothetical protein
MCPHTACRGDASGSPAATATFVSSYYYIYVSSYCHTCVLILLYIDSVSAGAGGAAHGLLHAAACALREAQHVVADGRRCVANGLGIH